MIMTTAAYTKHSRSVEDKHLSLLGGARGLRVFQLQLGASYVLVFMTTASPVH